MYGFLPVEAMASTLPFSMIVVAGSIPWDSRAISAKRGSLYACFDSPGACAATLDPFLALVYNFRNVSVVMRCPKYWETLCKAR